MGNSSPSESPPTSGKGVKDIGHWIGSRGRSRVSPIAIILEANTYKDLSILLWECSTQELDRKSPDARSQGPGEQQHPAFPRVKDVYHSKWQNQKEIWALTRLTLVTKTTLTDIFPKDIKEHEGSSHLTPWYEANFICFSVGLAHNIFNNSLLPGKKASFIQLSIQGYLSLTSSISLSLCSSFFQY